MCVGTQSGRAARPGGDVSDLPGAGLVEGAVQVPHVHPLTGELFLCCAGVACSELRRKERLRERHIDEQLLPEQRQACAHDVVVVEPEVRDVCDGDGGALTDRVKHPIDRRRLSGWGGVFGDQAVAAAMIDRIVHHADVLTLKGASYRLRGRGIDSLPSIKTQDPTD